jgi:hypothetical protein
MSFERVKSMAKVGMLAAGTLGSAILAVEIDGEGGVKQQQEVSEPSPSTLTPSGPEPTNPKLEEVRSSIIESAITERSTINKKAVGFASILEEFVKQAEGTPEKERYARKIGVRRESEGLTRRIEIAVYPEEIAEDEYIGGVAQYKISGEGTEILDYVWLHTPGVNIYLHPSESTGNKAVLQKTTGENGLKIESTTDYSADVLAENDDIPSAKTELKSLRELIAVGVKDASNTLEQIHTHFT